MREITITTTISNLEIDILKDLCSYDSDFYYSYDWLDCCNAGNKKEVRKSMQKLRILGLVDFQKGLMTEEGQVAGSGHSITKKGKDLINTLDNPELLNKTNE